MGRTLGMLTLIGLSVFVVMAKAIEEGRFGMDDLESLIQKGDWPEALQRLSDIPPPERPKNWDAVVEKVALGYLKETMVQDASQAETMALEMVKAYPSLTRSKAFRELRNRNALKGFGACLDVPDDRDECTKRLVEYVRAQPDDLVLAFDAGKLVGEKHKPDLAFGFFQRAMSSKTRARICSDPTAQKAMLAAMALPAGEASKGAAQMATKSCRDQMCPILKAKGKKC